MEYELKLTPDEMRIVQAGLCELPLKIVGAVFTKIQNAIAEQDAAKAVPIAEVLG